VDELRLGVREVLGARPPGPAPLWRRVRVGEVDEEGRQAGSTTFLVLELLLLLLELLSARITRGSKVGCCCCCDRGEPRFVIGDDDEEADAEERVNERAVDLVGDIPGMPIVELGLERMVLVLALLPVPGMPHAPVLVLPLMLRGGGRREGGEVIWRLRYESMLRSVDIVGGWAVLRGMGMLGERWWEVIVPSHVTPHLSHTNYLQAVTLRRDSVRVLLQLQYGPLTQNRTRKRSQINLAKQRHDQQLWPARYTAVWYAEYRAGG
jgi:hypothetical protein